MKTLSYKGPHPGILAIIFMVLFNTGLSFVISFSDSTHYPGPWESVNTLIDYFQNHSHDVLMCSFFQFGSAIPLGILTAAFVSRLKFLGANPPGTYIALFGGFATSISLIISASINWVMAYPGISQDESVLRALYYIGFAIGGVGYSVPLGLLIAGIAVTSGFMKALPKWMVAAGILLAIAGEASWFTMIFPDFLPLIPLTRFPGFIWLIIAGFMLPKTITSDLKTRAMKPATERKIIRWIHIILSIPLLGYVYGPVATMPNPAFVVRWVFIPVIILSGLWLWKGQWVKNQFRKRNNLSSGHV